MKNQELDNILTLTDEQGNPVDFEFVDLVEYKGEKYVVLLPTDGQDAEGGDVAILKVKECGEHDEFYGIDDENILNEVFAIFQQRVEEMLSEFEIIE